MRFSDDQKREVASVLVDAFEVDIHRFIRKATEGLTKSSVGMTLVDWSRTNPIAFQIFIRAISVIMQRYSRRENRSLLVNRIAEYLSQIPSEIYHFAKEQQVAPDSDIQQLASYNFADANQIAETLRRIDTKVKGGQFTVRQVVDLIPVIVVLLNHEEMWVRYFSAQLMGNIGYGIKSAANVEQPLEVVVSSLIECLNDTNDGIRGIAASKFDFLGEAPVNPFFDALRDKSIEALTIKINDESSLVSFHATRALEEIGTNKALQSLAHNRERVNEVKQKHASFDRALDAEKEMREHIDGNPLLKTVMKLFMPRE